MKHEFKSNKSTRIFAVLTFFNLGYIYLGLYLKGIIVFFTCNYFLIGLFNDFKKLKHHEIRDSNGKVLTDGIYCPKCECINIDTIKKEHLGNEHKKIKTEGVKEKHIDSKGRTIGYTIGEIEKNLLSSKYNIEYSCNNCNHKWSIISQDAIIV